MQDRSIRQRHYGFCLGGSRLSAGAWTEVGFRRERRRYPLPARAVTSCSNRRAKLGLTTQTATMISFGGSPPRDVNDSLRMKSCALHTTASGLAFVFCNCIIHTARIDGAGGWSPATVFGVHLQFRTVHRYAAS